MEWLINEVLFYGGLIIVGCSVISGIIYFCVSKIKAVRLKAQLDVEYGGK